MLRLALFFLIVSIVAGLFGFGGISSAAAGMAKILFFIAVIICVVLFALVLIGVGAVSR
ncbi:MAG: DUF1328 domain-containing protein [Acetobacter aceti]|uniref:DUF1328 domain-containing protein n=1 Tax=Acetobacter aceti TaxID=435 RepID=UPI00098A9611|nr:DUF1328 domain-containing protein [Acetobacter aceti]